MEIGILGTGMVGRTIGSKLIQLGHDVFMGARDADNPRAIAWAKEEGQRALYGTFKNAAAFGEIVFNCTLGIASLDALRQAGAGNLKNKILIDTSNPIDYSRDDLILSVCNGDSLGEQIQRAFPETLVVKTLNTMNCNLMVEPAKLPERTDVFVSGNDIEAKTVVIGILRDWFGWRSVIDLGDITTSRGVEMLLALWLDLRRVLPSDRFNIKVVKS
ncbi:MAG: NAD(P)-binding domain-containing protein [Chloroflexi bacterium]|nr:NAD(P)-binding domain-containing protein [Chloroflexota bacterium]MCL5612200.1 NAD(P)-binding domain-containing protein [Chloroflexota bacterium]